MDNCQELTGIVSGSNSIRGDLVEISVIEGQAETEVMTAAIKTETMSGTIVEENKIDGNIKDQNKINGQIQRNQYNGEIDTNEEMSGKIREVHRVGGNIQNKNQVYGNVVPPPRYRSRIQNQEEMTGYLSNSTGDIIKQILLILERLINEVEGNPTLGIEGLIYQVQILQQEIKEVAKIYYDTTANWNSQPQRLTKEGEIYIYSDGKYIDGHPVPRIKVGNGAYLIDITFIDQDYFDHIRNTVVHITQEEREYWNDKVGVTVELAEDGQQLQFYK